MVRPSYCQKPSSMLHWAQVESRSASRRESRTRDGRPEMKRKPRILIVEDDQNMIELYSFLLAQEGYETIPALGGHEALRLLEETEVDLIGLGRPVMAFYPGTELNNDPTNWWAPNPRALLGMLNDIGFTRIEVVTPPRTLAYRIARALKECLTQRRNPLLEYHRDRIVVHAWK